MISKRVLLIAAMLLVVSSTAAVAATVNVSNEVYVNVLNIGATDNLNITQNGSYVITNADPFSKIYGYVSTGFNGGVWDGVGGIIGTKPAEDASTYSIGCISNADSGYSTFMGQPVTGASVLMLSTLIGDVTLDGIVDGTDYDLLYSNFGASGMTWIGGDMTYDGVVDGTDYDLMYANFGRSITLLGPPPAAAAAAAAVPEPSSVVLLSLFGVSALLFWVKNRK